MEVVRAASCVSRVAVHCHQRLHFLMVSPVVTNKQTEINFDDGNGYLDTRTGCICRFVWRDDAPYAQWKQQPIHWWSAKDLYGISREDWRHIMENAPVVGRVNRLVEVTADDIFWTQIISKKLQ